MEKPMRNVGDQTVTPSQLGSDAHRDAFQTATLQTEVTETKLLKPNERGDGVTFSRFATRRPSSVCSRGTTRCQR